MNLYRVLTNTITVICCAGILLAQTAGAAVIETNSRTFLVDQNGERWDITQARSIGFDPRHFEFGIGRNAFRPLGESDWLLDAWKDAFDFRVIGTADGKNAHAYSVGKLSRHETANTVLSSKSILAAY
jgi:hypothetical protein